MQTLAELAWQQQFVNAFPGDPEQANFVRQVRAALYSPVLPTSVKNPRLVGWSDALARDLNIARDDQTAAILAGNDVVRGMRPYAARYGGHQFGSWAGQLGDGRAITLGEIAVPHRGSRLVDHGSAVRNPEPAAGDGWARAELQLKGAGPTPYSRRGDGRAVLRSSLREFLCSEAMYHLGVPTTRALSLVTTGQGVTRDMFYDGNPEVEPGAVVCRVAPTFLRFGNFEILAASGEDDLLKNLADWVIRQYYADIDPRDPDAYGLFLDDVARRTARMALEWMRVGFVHGVMNTDNMSILGVTIDYGPYGWLEPYDLTWTPNTTDAGQGRYRFGNQPGIALWNVSRLAAALYPVINDESRLEKSLDAYRAEFQSGRARVIAAKLGLQQLKDDDEPLVEEMYALMSAAETDYTIFFRGLSTWDTRDHDSVHFAETISQAIYGDAMDNALKTKWTAWATKYAARVSQDAQHEPARLAAMTRVNPKYVLRNYLAQQAIDAATTGDYSPMNRLLRVLETPYDDSPADEDLAQRRPDWARSRPGCSALSCSS